MFRDSFEKSFKVLVHSHEDGISVCPALKAGDGEAATTDGALATLPRAVLGPQSPHPHPLSTPPTPDQSSPEFLRRS